jgi:transcriptional regulator with XRE-family HTH domain
MGYRFIACGSRECPTHEEIRGIETQVLASKKTTEVLRFIAANVRRLRWQRSLTQQALSDLADVDLRFIQRIERGTTNLSIGALVALSEALDVEPTAMFRPAELILSKPGRPPKREAPRRSASAARSHPDRRSTGD